MSTNWLIQLPNESVDNNGLHTAPRVAQIFYQCCSPRPGEPGRYLAKAEMFGQPPQNPDKLVVIKTARTFEEINSAAAKGIRPLVKPVDQNSDIHNMVAVYQHRETGQVELIGDCRSGPSDDNYECVLPFRHYYQYSFPSPFAAYLVPPELVDGQRVWLDDVIEDIVAVYGNQGYHPRLKGCEAIWTNGDFVIQFDPKNDAPRWLG